jgi:hypothetical protein
VVEGQTQLTRWESLPTSYPPVAVEVCE